MFNTALLVSSLTTILSTAVSALADLSMKVAPLPQANITTLNLADECVLSFAEKGMAGYYCPSDVAIDIIDVVA